MSSFKLENYYTHIKKDKKDNEYPNQKIINIPLPARVIMVGSSGSGKTNLLMNLIKGIGVFEKFVLLAKDLEEPLYQHLINTFREIEIILKKKFLLAINSIKDLPTVDDWDPSEQNLLICDDLITENKKDLEKISEYFIRGRKKNITMFFLSQNYYSIPKLVRQNSQFIIFKKVESSKDLKMMISQYGLSVSPEQLMKMYEIATKDGDLTSFFMVDTLTNDPKLRFRNGFSPFNLS